MGLVGSVFRLIFEAVTVWVMKRLHHWPLVFWILAFLILGGGLLAIQNNGSKTPEFLSHYHEYSTVLSPADRVSIEALSTSFSSLEEALGSGSSLTPWARSVVVISQSALSNAHKEGDSALANNYSNVLSVARSIIAHPQSSVSGRWRQASALSGYVDALMTESVS
jgi:hypothetical protein